MSKIFINKIPTRKIKGKYLKFGTLEQDNYMYKIIKTNINAKEILLYHYLGMGTYGFVIEDNNEGYHNIIIGGANIYDKIHSYILYYLYDFSIPCGKLKDLNNNLTNITFCILESNDEKKIIDITSSVVDKIININDVDLNELNKYIFKNFNE